MMCYSRSAWFIDNSARGLLQKKEADRSLNSLPTDYAKSVGPKNFHNKEEGAMRKNLMSLVLVSCVLAIVGMPMLAQAKVVKIGSIAPPNNGHTKSLIAMAEYVKEKTNGRIEIEVFPLGQLGNERSMCSQVQSGTLEMVSSTTSVLENFIPEVAAFDLPFLYPNVATAHAVLDDPEVKAKLFAYFEKKGFIGLGFAEDGERQTFNTKRPIRKPEDFKGLKIRTMNSPMMLETFKAFGASPVGIPFPEVYSALQTGVAEGVNASYLSAALMKFPEVAKYMTDYNFHMNAPITVAGADFWASLSKEDQQIMRDGAALATKINREINAKVASALPPKMDINVDQYLKAQNVQIVTLTAEEREAFKKAVKPVWDSTREKIGNEMIDFLVAKVKEHQQ
jgi:TRAP-type transport system periplasmic protein